MSSLLYNLILKPLILFYELSFSVVDKLLSSRGYGNYLFDIVIVSLIVNLLTLPLYSRADKIQKEIRKKKESMKDMINHIKAHFKGDEQYFMLSTYYKENNYKPIYALNESISLLLQIPFFTAAYMFFSGLTYLNGEQIIFKLFSGYYLVFSENLFKPDAMLTICT